MAIVVLAAGAGTRFGGAKQLASIDGRPALVRVLDAVAGLGAPQVVVLGAHVERVVGLLEGMDWRAVVAPDWQLGPGASLRVGLAVVPDAEAALIVLGDLPWLDPEAARRVAAAVGPVARAYEGDEPGHPLLLRGEALAAARAAPDAGMREALAGFRQAKVRCDGLGVARDLDRPLTLEGARPRSDTPDQAGSPPSRPQSLDAGKVPLLPSRSTGKEIGCHQ
jgi:molybdenum cofactor cytidylyltransferase